jgi:alpha-pyrone synthase
LLQRAHINRIAAAVPDHDIHKAFVAFGSGMLREERARSLFLRMSSKSGISHRYSPLQVEGPPAPGAVDAHELYRLGAFPGTEKRMEIFEHSAPRLLRATLDQLQVTPSERDRIRHVIVTGCTGLYAPGLDFVAMDYLHLSPETERTMIGFMGCYAAINGLKQARHIVRSEPSESVLLINLELCSLHLHETQNLSEVLSFLVFGDGCAATLISSDPVGLAIDGFRALQIPDTRDLITWRLGDLGFDMLLSGQVPGEIEKALHSEASSLLAGEPTDPIDLWAVHPGGRSVLDAVEAGLNLSPSALSSSRKVLNDFGNMSSATVMFVLKDLMRFATSGQRGCAMSFGPGLTAETMGFHVV